MPRTPFFISHGPPTSSTAVRQQFGALPEMMGRPGADDAAGRRGRKRITPPVTVTGTITENLGLGCGITNMPVRQIREAGTVDQSMGGGNVQFAKGDNSRQRQKRRGTTLRAGTADATVKEKAILHDQGTAGTSSTRRQPQGPLPSRCKQSHYRPW